MASATQRTTDPISELASRLKNAGHDIRRLSVHISSFERQLEECQRDMRDIRARGLRLVQSHSPNCN